MEALLQLEKVQRVLSLMGSRGLSDPTADGGGGDRFLANFLLFLVWFAPLLFRRLTNSITSDAQAMHARASPAITGE
jgi:hypothetical protein